jgi:hypothetical protein
MIQFEKVGQENNRHGSQIKKMIRQVDGTLAPEEVDALTADAVYLAYTDTGEMAGVTTASKNKMTSLNNHCLYRFNCFVDPLFRHLALETELSRITFEWLEEKAHADVENPIGIFSVLQSDKPLQKGIWPELNMYLMGFTSRGYPIRIHYFKKARI